MPISKIALVPTQMPESLGSFALTDAVQRVGLGVGRPLLLGNVRTRVKTLLDERTPIYEAVASVGVDPDGRRAMEVVGATEGALAGDEGDGT